jgi:hypothetical protein
MRDTIVNELKSICGSRGVRLLHASEAGSRAWGYAAEDSDYDVKFVYTRPVIDYINLSKGDNDTIVIQGDNIEYHGWDVRKFFQLLGTGAGAGEIYYAPNYTYDPVFSAQIEGIMTGSKPLGAWCMHYRGITRNNFMRYIKQKELMDDEVPITKKYIHVMRAVVNARYIETYKDFPHNNMLSNIKLLTQSTTPLPSHVTAEVQHLIQRKIDGVLEVKRRIDRLDDFIQGELTRWEENRPNVHSYKIPQEELLRAFRITLGIG